MRVEHFHYPGERVKHPWHVLDPNHPTEDRAVWADDRAAVFDGLTVHTLGPYPNPSPAAMAAEIACGIVLAEEFDADRAEISLKSITEAIIAAIGEFNATRGVTPATVNHRDLQYASVVGAFAFVEDGQLYGVQVNDTELAVIGPDGEYRMLLRTDIGPREEMIAYHQDQGDFQGGSAEQHVFVRTHISNNPDATFRGREIKAGLFNGQPIPEQFVNVGSIALSPVDTILIYSDGMIPFLEDSEVRKFLGGSDDLAGFGSLQQSLDIPRDERTLLVIREVA